MSVHRRANSSASTIGADLRHPDGDHRGRLGDRDPRDERSTSRRKYAEAALTAILLALAGAGWWYAGQGTHEMPGSGLEVGDVGLYLGSWVAMMAAMMFPSIVPMVVVYDRLRRARRARDGGAPGVDGTVLFVAGYLITWTLAAIAAYALIALGRWVDTGPSAWGRLDNELVAAVVLAGAA